MKENYMEKLDAWLKGEINKLFDAIENRPAPQLSAAVSAFKKVLKDKVLESFRNGQHSRRSRSDSEPRKKVQK